MAESGNMIGNLINWWIGMIIMEVYLFVGYWLGIFGMWQFGVDGVTSVYDSFKPSDVGDHYMTEMSIGN